MGNPSESKTNRREIIQNVLHVSPVEQKQPDFQPDLINQARLEGYEAGLMDMNGVEKPVIPPTTTYTRRKFLLGAGSAVLGITGIGTTIHFAKKPLSQDTLVTEIQINEPEKNKILPNPLLGMSHVDGSSFIIDAENLSTLISTFSDESQVTILQRETHDERKTTKTLLHFTGGQHEPIYVDSQITPVFSSNDNIQAFILHDFNPHSVSEIIFQNNDSLEYQPLIFQPNFVAISHNDQAAYLEDSSQISNEIKTAFNIHKNTLLETAEAWNTFHTGAVTFVKNLPHSDSDSMYLSEFGPVIKASKLLDEKEDLQKILYRAFAKSVYYSRSQTTQESVKFFNAIHASLLTQKEKKPSVISPFTIINRVNKTNESVQTTDHQTQPDEIFADVIQALFLNTERLNAHFVPATPCHLHDYEPTRKNLEELLRSGLQILRDISDDPDQIKRLFLNNPKGLGRLMNMDVLPSGYPDSTWEQQTAIEYPKPTPTHDPFSTPTPESIGISNGSDGVQGIWQPFLSPTPTEEPSPTKTSVIPTKTPDTRPTEAVIGRRRNDIDSPPNIWQSLPTESAQSNQGPSYEELCSA